MPIMILVFEHPQHVINNDSFATQQGIMKLKLLNHSRSFVLNYKLTLLGLTISFNYDSFVTQQGIMKFRH